MTSIDQDKQIAAASLLALVGSVPTSDSSDDSGEVKVTKRKPNREDEEGPPPKRLTQDSSFCDSPKKVSDDESSQRNQRSASMISINDGEADVSRRFSCPVAHVSKTDRMMKSFKPQQVPIVLMKLLTTDGSDELMRSMFFLPDNNNFVIRNTKEFLEFIMPKYFQMTKFGCFIKKLERWGFGHTVIDKESDQHFFHHPFFSRNNWALLRNIRYTPMRGESAPKSKKYSTTSIVTRQSIERKDDRRIDGSDIPKPNLQSMLYREPMLSRQELETGLTSLANIRDQASSSSFESFSRRSSLLPPVSQTIPNSVCFQSQTAMNNATKDIVAKAIDCLLFDEEHTLQLLARRGQELNTNRRLSLPSCLYRRAG
eukprot:CAMPEP_0203662508 /NCGR_PEP_ID=MMETSP0090-20130426/454_1 /ASSEMBLY_ACC=CAM_ASM_001088 /TAXON_ID=426623 /ORGANISM="Chaetoceros affinis, Strain CCMP159" /LENGTH=369 /DNA_ID=CAMNT_0050525307 /DNA_START=48 /DNA_END=1157 /DNA_ORIENTATION=-